VAFSTLLTGWRPRARRRACFDTALAFLGGFGSPFGVILGNHDLEGAEFETDEQNLAAWQEARHVPRVVLSGGARPTLVVCEAALMVHQLCCVRGRCCVLYHQHSPDRLCAQTACWHAPAGLPAEPLLGGAPGAGPLRRAQHRPLPLQRVLRPRGVLCSVTVSRLVLLK